MSSAVTSSVSSRAALELARKIESREVAIGVLGLGYVGLPLALAFAKQGVAVVGFDVDTEKVEALRAGHSYIKHLEGPRLTEATAAGLFRATSDFSELSGPDVLLICVPTPLTPQREPDMSFVVGTVRQIQPRLRRGQLVVLESTTYPGTTDELVRGILEQSGLKCGEDFFLAFSPEREDPGNSRYATASIPKVVGGVDPVSGDLAQAVYDLAIDRTVRVSTARTAEATKLVENIFRAVNIALVNELKMVFDKMGIDVWEVLDAASTKPFGFMRFNPGPGLGGHCIPLDPFYLAWKAREYGVTAKFIELAGEVNVQMPHYVVEKLQYALNERGKAVKGSRILDPGTGLQEGRRRRPREPGVRDHRCAASSRRGRFLSRPPRPARRRGLAPGPTWPRCHRRPLTPERLAAQDAVVIVTDHSGVDYDLVVRNAPLVVDSRGVYRQPMPNVVKA